jgi:AraC-like DNA-binding protein
MEHIIWSQPMLNADGNLLIAGGVEMNADGSPDNFTPVATTLLLSVGKHVDPQAAADRSAWLYIGLVLLAIGIVVIILRSRHKRTEIPVNQVKTPTEKTNVNFNTDLMQRICQMMEEQKLYLNADMKLQDLADLLGTNRTYIIDCIKTTRGQSFTQLINSYRIEHAKQLLCQQPDKKMSAIATESGFTTETTFFRTFKTITGITPSEWRTRYAKID